MSSLLWIRRRAVLPVCAGGMLAAALLLAGCGGGGGGDAATPGAATQATSATHTEASADTFEAANPPDIVVDDTGTAVSQLSAGPAVTWAGGTSEAEDGGIPGPDSRRYGIDVCECSAVSDATAS